MRLDHNFTLKNRTLYSLESGKSILDVMCVLIQCMEWNSGTVEWKTLETKQTLVSLHVCMKF